MNKSQRYREKWPDKVKASSRVSCAKQRSKPGYAGRNLAYGKKHRGLKKKLGIKRSRLYLAGPGRLQQELNHLRDWLTKNPEATLLQNIKRRANKSGIMFDLKIGDVGKVPKTCPVFGIPLVRGKKYSSPNSPTLDRVNPTKGYTKGNVAWISNLANGMKSNATADQHRRIADWMDRFLRRNPS